MAVQVISLVNYAIVLTNPAYTLKPFENKIFTNISAITGDLAAKDALKQLQAEVMTPIDTDDGGGQAIVTAENEALAKAVTTGPSAPSSYYLACIPGRQFVGSGAPKDLSNNACDGIIGAGTNDATVWATNGYMTTAAGATNNVSLPLAKTTFNLATESLLFSVLVKKTATGSSEQLFGNGDGVSTQGVYLSFRATTGKVRPVVNSSGGVINGLTDSTAVFADGNDHVLTVAFDAVTKQIALYRDGALSDLYNANFLGSTTPTVNFFLGAAPSGGSIAQFSGVHLLKFTGGLPINLNRIAARLAARPFDYLSDSDIQR